jgi:Mitochondrial mRNA-processing protein COX24, C-terminal
LLTELQRADIRRARRDLPAALAFAVVSQPRRATGRVSVLMGSLIKKRRKRMRKKKHKKMLKRTRFQRRAKGK